MLFGYILARPLLILMRVFARRPNGVRRAFAAVLNAATGPFHVVNRLGHVGAAGLLGPRRMASAARAPPARPSTTTSTGVRPCSDSRAAR